MATRGQPQYPYRSNESKILPVRGSDARRPALQRAPWILTPGVSFNDWYEKNIVRGIQDFKTECGRVIDQVVRVLQQEKSLNVKEVVKGGSLGKGTMLKGISDIDCVVILNSPSLPYLKDVRNMSTYVSSDLENAVQCIDRAIKNSRKDYSLVGTTETNEHMVTATLRVSGVDVKVDLLPTADNLAVEGKLRIYNSMLQRSKEDKEFYSPGLVKLQKEFIREKPGVVKELIRIVKYWNTQVVGSVLKGKECLPTSYPMELLTILAWERAGSPGDFDKLQGFKAVLTVVADGLPTLNHYWTTNYSQTMAQQALSKMDAESKQRPSILDPANPTNNVCARFHGTWKDVGGVARDTLRTNLLSGVKVNARWK